uniref:Uncharacterized protein n=1 Tax=Anabas testudineus TaxID=64144 RepID=A0A7N5ZVE6_ANATE
CPVLYSNVISSSRHKSVLFALVWQWDLKPSLCPEAIIQAELLPVLRGAASSCLGLASLQQRCV